MFALLKLLNDRLNSRGQVINLFVEVVEVAHLGEDDLRQVWAQLPGRVANLNLKPADGSAQSACDSVAQDQPREAAQPTDTGHSPREPAENLLVVRGGGFQPATVEQTKLRTRPEHLNFQKSGHLAKCDLVPRVTGRGYRLPLAQVLAKRFGNLRVEFLLLRLVRHFFDGLQVSLNTGVQN